MTRSGERGAILFRPGLEHARQLIEAVFDDALVDLAAAGRERELDLARVAIGAPALDQSLVDERHQLAARRRGVHRTGVGQAADGERPVVVQARSAA